MAYKLEEFNIEVGTSIISAFQRIDIENYRIFSEFIDNSFQSFLDHRKELFEIAHIKSCKVDITWTSDEVVIKDNAFGMLREDFSRALRLNAPAKNYSEGSLSKYGMGLKYAACNVGSVYTVETSALGSKDKFKATVDIEHWKKDNPTSMSAEVDDDYDENAHFTYIVIKNPYHSFKTKEMNKTIKQLAKMYSRFLEKKELSITINGNNVKYDDPELDKDANGGDIMESFDSSFIHEGKTYKYWGWIGVLKTGSTSDAGFTIIQNNRGIIFNFRKGSVFGGPNTFEYQRLVGEIELDKDSWDVRVNKDGIAWNANGLLEVFLEDLANLDKVKKIKKYSHNKRTGDKISLNVKTQNCSVSGASKSYKIGERICFTVSPDENCEISSVKINNIVLSAQNEEKTKYAYDFTASDPAKSSLNVICKESKTTISNNGSKPGVVITPPTGVVPPIHKEPILSRNEIIGKMFDYLKNVKVIGESINTSPNLFTDAVIVKYENTSFSFELNDINDEHENYFMELKAKHHPFENSYILNVNFGCGLFKRTNLSTDIKDSLFAVGISLALARIIGENSGIKLSDSKILIDKFNEIVVRTNK